jgi:hypothetical protein
VKNRASIAQYKFAEINWLFFFFFFFSFDSGARLKRPLTTPRSGQLCDKKQKALREWECQFMLLACFYGGVSHGDEKNAPIKIPDWPFRLF